MPSLRGRFNLGRRRIFGILRRTIQGTGIPHARIARYTCGGSYSQCLVKATRRPTSSASCFGSSNLPKQFFEMFKRGYTSLLCSGEMLLVRDAKPLLNLFWR